MARTAETSKASARDLEPAPATARNRPRIAIIGGGATGVLAAAHLDRAGVTRTSEIVIVEPRGDLGRGLAYSTPDPAHLLNVRVSNMSAFADESDHLIGWLSRHGPAHGVASPHAFLSRWVYGAYISDIARGLLARGAVRHLRAECLKLAERGGAAELTLDNGEKLVAWRVLIATGNDAKPDLDGVEADRPWTREASADLPSDAELMILGSGLTMVDMALSMRRRGHVGKIHVLSRRGLMPNGHRPVAARSLAAAEIPFGAPLTKLLRWLVGEAKAMQRDGGDWRGAIDALRPHTTTIWRAMTHDQRRRFLRHLRPYWDAHRHRMAPEIEHAIGELIEIGQVQRIAGRVISAHSTNSGIEVTLRRRGASAAERLTVSRLIDCTGLADEIRRSRNPLIHSLLQSGAARPGPLGIGLDVDERFALLDAQGRSSMRISVIGPIVRGAFWECIAIPDIRRHCQDFATDVAKAFLAQAVA